MTVSKNRVSIYYGTTLDRVVPMTPGEVESTLHQIGRVYEESTSWQQGETWYHDFKDWQGELAVRVVVEPAEAVGTVNP